MKIDVDPQALREFITLLREWHDIGEDDEDWRVTTDKTVALLAMSTDLLGLLGEETMERTERYAAYLAKNKYYRPMVSP